MLPENILNLINYVKQIQEQFNYTVTLLLHKAHLTYAPRNQHGFLEANFPTAVCTGSTK